MGWYRTPDVERVGGVMTRGQLSEVVDWGLKLQGIPDQWREGKGEGIKIAVIDTGAPDHPDLPSPSFSLNFTTDSSVRDRQGHATHVAGIIGARANSTGVVGVSPACEIGYAKGLADNGYGRWDWLARAIRACVDEGATIINMSFGGGGVSDQIASAIEYAVRNEVTCVAAAGNSGSRGVEFPATHSQTLAVASYNRRGNVSSFSSKGPQVDYAAPGEDILSTWTENRYQRLSGTSMACPFMCGMLGLMKSAGFAIRANEVRSDLKQIADDRGPRGHDSGWGWGVLDLSLLPEDDDDPEDPEEVQLGPYTISLTENGALLIR